MSMLHCPRCGKRLEDIDEHFESETSAEADVDGDCEHCGAKLKFQRRVNYSVSYETEEKV